MMDKSRTKDAKQKTLDRKAQRQAKRYYGE